MFFKASVALGFIAGASALPQVSQISDGQIQVPNTTPVPVSQISDGQIQNPKTTPVIVSQISDGQIQNPAPSQRPVSQISDGQIQAGTTTATNVGSGYYTPLPYSYNQSPSVNSAAVSSAAAYAGIPASDIPGATDAVPPVISSQVTGITSHGPYNGPAPTTTGAISNSPAGTAIPMLPPNPTALVYNPNGTLNNQEPIPYQPAGGLGTNGTEPVYRVQSDFDYQSILLGLYQEWIELDLFHNILATFSEEEFTAAGLTPSDRFLIEFMADQESGHATLLSNLLGGPGGATPQCEYHFSFHKSLDFCF
jgi:hypothetical protein